MMILPSLLPALSLAGGDHAALHPAEASFYVEVPDLQELARAYADAPLVLFLADPQVEGFAARVAGADPEDYRLDEEALSALESALTSADPALGEAFALLFEARGASLSVTVEPPSPTAADGGGETSGAGAPSVHLLAAIELSSAETAAHAAQVLATAVGGSDLESGGECERTLPWIGGETLLWSRLRGSTLFVGIGRSAREGLAGRLEDPERSLAGDADFLAGRSQMSLEEGVVVYECFLRLRDIAATVTTSGPEDLAAQAAVAAGVDAFFPGDGYSAHERTRLVDSRFVQESYAPDPPDRAGLGGAIGRRSLPPEALQLLPANAIGAWVTTLEPDVLRQELERFLTLASGLEPDERRAKWQEDYGFDPFGDLIGALGSRCALYSLPITGLVLPKIHLALDLEDPQAFERGVQGIGRWLVEISGGEVQVKSRPYRNHPVYTFAPKQDIGEFAGGMGAPSAFVSVVPSVVESELALTIVDGRAILGLGDQGVKREIKRLLLGGAEELHPLATGAFAFPEEATSVGFLDWGTILDGLYGTFRAFVPLIAQAAEELPFDPADLPEADVFERHFGPTWSWTVRRERGTYEREESSFGPEVSLVLLGGAGAAASAWWLGERRSIVPPAPQPVVEAKPIPAPAPASPPPAPAEDPLELTRQRLLEVKLALVVYKTDQGAYPAELAALFDPTARFPQGFLEAGTPLEDAWGRSLVYERGAQGASFLLWSLGPDGVDERGAGDDLSVR